MKANYPELNLTKNSATKDSTQKGSDIDFVVLWIDGNDPERLAQVKKYKLLEEGKIYEKNRYRDWGIFKYFFRSIESNTPWFRKLHIVTHNKLPKWLNTKHPKLNIVYERDLFKDKKCLPTFNSNAVQLNLANIKGLSEKFVLFDDDFFIIKSTSQERFFKNNLPVDYINLIASTIPSQAANPWAESVHHNLHRVEQYHKMGVLSMIMRKAIHPIYSSSLNINNLKKLYRHIRTLGREKYSGMYVLHAPQGLIKSNMIRVNKLHEEEYTRTTNNRFRTSNDMIWSCYRYHQILSGEFIPYHVPREIALIKIKKGIKVRDEVQRHLTTNPNLRYICLNDDYPDLGMNEEEQEVHRDVIQTLEELFPQKSSFELG